MENKKAKNRIKYLLLLAPLSFVLGSCGGANFSSAENFGNSSLEVQNAAKDFAKDIYKSCLRRTNFVSFVDPDGEATRDRILATCELAPKKDSQNFQQAVEVLITYMEKISAVASGKDLSTDESIGNLGTSIKELTINGQKLDEGAVDGGIKILQFIFDLVTKRIREDALRKAFVCTNEPIHQYITGNPVPRTDQNGVTTYEPASGGLIFVVEEGYIKGTLQIERESANNYFVPYFAALGKLGNERVIDQITVEKDYNKVLSGILEKKEAAEAFNQTLLKTAMTHNNLKKEFAQGLSQEEIVKLCQTNSQVSLKKMDKEQWQHIQKILNEYVTAVKPLIEKVDKAF